MRTLTYEDILACSGHLVAIDVETTGLHWWKDGLIGVGIHCPTANVSGYVHTCTYEDRPFGKAKVRRVWKGEMDYSKSKRGKRVLSEEIEQPTVCTAVPNPVRIKHFIKAVQAIADNPKTTLLGHNLKFDALFLQLNLWEKACKIMDTSIMVHLIDSRLRKSLEAAEATFLEGNSKRKHVAKADKRFEKQVWLWGPKVIEDYCVNDCVVTYQLAETLMPIIREMDLLKLFKRQMDYLRFIQKMQYQGVKIDSKFCRQAIAEFDKNIQAMEQDLFDACGKEFNWRSWQQLSKALYDDMGIPKPKNPFMDDDGVVRSRSAIAKKYTESATSEFMLVKKGNHPFGPLVLDLRETAKIREYAKKYIELQDSNGFIHASFNLTGAVTGRLSSSDPNLQNLPAKNRKRDKTSGYIDGVRREGAYNLRQAMIARPGHKILSIDHKQQEVRLLAILADEPVMLEAMRLRQDIHRRVAITLWGDCGPEQNEIHRDWSKAIAFGLIYGLSDDSFQEHLDGLGIEMDAYTVKNQYFSAFPGLLPWFDQVQDEVKDQGYTRYWSGRYWYADNEGDAYKAINSRIQGGCADFMAEVVMRCDQVLSKQGWGHCASIIHDEVLFEIREDCLAEAAPVLARTMEGEDIFGIPFAVDVEVGDSYGALKSYPVPADLSEIDWTDYI